MTRSLLLTGGAAAFVLASALVLAAAGSLPNDPRQVERGRQLTLTKSKADVDGDHHPETLVLVNAMTGESDPARATEVILGIAAPDQGKSSGPLLWARHVARDTAAPAHDGEVEAVDLDGDGASEVVLSWDRALSDKGVDRWCEIYSVKDPIAPRKVWEGPIERDARRDPKAKPEDRLWMRREFDYSATRKEAGKAIVFSTRRTWADAKPGTPPAVEQERFEVSLRSY